MIERQNPRKNNRKNWQNSKKLIATVAEHRTGNDNMNVPPEERIARSVAKSAISLNVAVPIEK